MLISYEGPNILGSYQQNEYSPAFQMMMSRVVARIYRHKNHHNKLMITNILSPSVSMQQHVKTTQKDHSQVQLTYRKNSSNPSKFFSLQRSGFNESPKLNRLDDTCLKSEQKLRSTTLTTQRCRTQPRTTLNVSLCKKISEYNQCLITKTCKFQDKYKMATETCSLSSIPSKIKNSERVPMYKKFENFRSHKKQISCKSRVIASKTSPILQTQAQIGFRPWQDNQPEQTRLFLDC